uniref:PIH1 domain containing 3 n=1 Tax=Amazona collaria TaxID=241587 RepID=A0A8B9G373_9PSIT
MRRKTFCKCLCSLKKFHIWGLGEDCFIFLHFTHLKFKGKENILPLHILIHKMLSKTIWNTEEVPEGSEYDDTWDPREQPEYEILFKQRVGTEDVFFGMSRKDHSTACCEDIVIKIKLPETKSSDITLDIQDKVLDLRTPKKKLLLHLPYSVDSKNGKARFFSEEEILEVTLRVLREFDFINFG